MHTHRIQNTQRTTQDTENRTENTDTNNHAQPQHRCSAHNYRTYSFDLYHEQIYIKNSNTIEIYTILK